MEKVLKKMLNGYDRFRQKYAAGDQPVMEALSRFGQKPHSMVVACCDSRVDPALILQCDPGDLFVVRNVANIVPPYEKDDAHHGTSAALEFGVRALGVQHLILLGHSQCGGIASLFQESQEQAYDFVNQWVSLVTPQKAYPDGPDEYAKVALQHSHKNCLTFPWIQERVVKGELAIHLWFFDIHAGQIYVYSEDEKRYFPLDGSI